MVHADYHCCAVCDSKMAYAGADAETKEHICSWCVAALAKQGVIIPDVEALLDYIRQTSAEELQRVLAAVGFRYCQFPNMVDEAVKARGISDIRKENGEPSATTAKHTPDQERTAEDKQTQVCPLAQPSDCPEVRELRKQLSWLIEERKEVGSVLSDAAYENTATDEGIYLAQIVPVISLSEAIRRLAARAQKVEELERQLTAVRKWAADTLMILRSFALQAEMAESTLPEGVIRDVSPEEVRGIFGDLDGMTPEEYREHLYHGEYMDRIEDLEHQLAAEGEARLKMEGTRPDHHVACSCCKFGEQPTPDRQTQTQNEERDND